MQLKMQVPRGGTACTTQLSPGRLHVLCDSVMPDTKWPEKHKNPTGAQPKATDKDKRLSRVYIHTFSTDQKRPPSSILGAEEK